MIYCFDTSALIGAWVRKYPPDLFPGFWEHLEDLIASDRLIWSEEVERELEKQHDQLHEWVSERNKASRPLSDDVQHKTSEVLTRFPLMLNTKGQKPTADPFIVALAAVSDATLVTEEGPSGTLKRLHIPDVCQEMDIPCFDLLGFIRHEKVRFGRI